MGNVVPGFHGGVYVNNQDENSKKSKKNKKRRPKAETSQKDVAPKTPQHKYNALTLDLTNNQLQHLPNDAFLYTNLQHLCLFQNRFDSSPPQPNLRSLHDVELLQGLKSIDLSFNQLETIPEAITRLPLLNTLVLVGNNISTLPTSIINLKNLQNLKMASNNLNKFPSSLLMLPKLYDLQLTRNKISKFEFVLEDDENIVMSVFNNNLQQLHLEENNLRKLPEEIGMLTSLITLKLSENKIESLPSSLATITTLESLILDKNRISKIPPELGKMKNLRTLILSHNSIKELPLEWFERTEGEQVIEDYEPMTVLPSLFELFLDNNKISDFHTKFSTVFKNLRLLAMNNNRVTKLPASIENMSCLLSLELGSNKLDVIPSEICYLNKLEKLLIFDNNLQSIPSLTALTGLKILYLGYNPIMETPQLPSSLDELHLGGCNLSHFPFEILNTVLTSLRVLHLGHNQIKEIPTDLSSFQSHSLRKLDIHQNLIEDLPSSIFDKLSTFSGFYLDIRDNPLLNKEKYKELVHSDGSSFVPSTRFRISHADMKGKRPEMEDVFCVQGSFGGDPMKEFIGLFDGHGGSEIAAYVGSTLHKNLLEELNKGNTPNESLIKSFEVTNEGCHAFLQKTNGLQRRIGCTGVVGIVIEKKMLIANVGDSRAVLCRQGKAFRISFDHKPLQREERNRIRDLGGFVMSNGRVNGILAVARSFGDFFLQPYISAYPYISEEIEISEEDEFLIFACDGVWDVISDKAAVKIVRDCLKQYRGDTHKAASKLRDLAYLNGSGDNITVIVVLLHV